MTSTDPSAATTEPAVYVNGIYISGSLIAKSRGVAAKLETEGNLYSAGVVRELATKLEATRVRCRRRAPRDHAAVLAAELVVGLGVLALSGRTDSAATVRDVALGRVADMQADWFVREVKPCREIGMPLDCCDDWPECSHVLAWIEERDA